MQQDKTDTAWLAEQLRDDERLEEAYEDGDDVDRYDIREIVDEEGEIAFHCMYLVNSMAGSGYTRAMRWRGRYFRDIEDGGFDGPFRTIEEALVDCWLGVRCEPGLFMEISGTEAGVVLASRVFDAEVGESAFLLHGVAAVYRYPESGPPTWRAAEELETFDHGGERPLIVVGGVWT
ncbi:MAG: hypothetical protein ACK51E_02685 [Gemmatimonadota bacterium]|jgi:hypothetical protein